MKDKYYAIYCPLIDDYTGKCSDPFDVHAEDPNELFVEITKERFDLDEDKIKLDKSLPKLTFEDIWSEQLWKLVKKTDSRKKFNKTVLPFIKTLLES